MIPDNVKLSGTLRALTDDRFSSLRKRINEVCLASSCLGIKYVQP